MRFVSFGDKRQISASVGFWIEKRRAHAEECSGNKDAVAGLIFRANLCLTSEKRSQERVAVGGPEGRLQTKRERDAVIGVEQNVLHGTPGGGILRQPDTFVGRHES